MRIHLVDDLLQTFKIIGDLNENKNIHNSISWRCHTTNLSNRSLSRNLSLRYMHLRWMYGKFSTTFPMQMGNSFNKSCSFLSINSVCIGAGVCMLYFHVVGATNVYMVDMRYNILPFVYICFYKRMIQFRLMWNKFKNRAHRQMVRVAVSSQECEFTFTLFSNILSILRLKLCENRWCFIVHTHRLFYRNPLHLTLAISCTGTPNR